MQTIEVLQRLDKETKAEVYFVGGFVRDYLRRKKNDDLDVIVKNLSLRNVKKFLKRYGKAKEVKLCQTNDDFIISVMLFRAEGSNIEAQITMPRRGKKQIPDSHNTLKQDVRFRDFKINCLYLPVNYKSRNDVIDLVGGVKDIAKRRLTANGSPTERIKESPIRMMRAISLASRTNYTIDRELLDAIKANANTIWKCPAEAIRKEFNTILMSRKPSRYLRLLKKTGLLSCIAPEVNRCAGVKQDNRYHKYDVLTHLFYSVDNCDADLTIRLAALLHDVGKRKTKVENKNGSVSFHKHELVSHELADKFLHRMKYDRKTKMKVLFLVKMHMYHYTRDWTDQAVRRFIRKAGLDERYLNEKNIGNFPLFKLRAGERLGGGLKTIPVTDRQRDFERRLIKVYKESTGLTIKDLAIDGNVVMETFRIEQGVQVGKLLNFLLDKVMERPGLNNKLDLLKLALDYLHSGDKDESR